MATNKIQEGILLTVPAPAGGVLTGAPVLIGGIFGIAQTTAEEAADVEIDTTGVYSLTKTGGVAAYAIGDICYWNPTTKVVEKTDSVDNIRIGACIKIALIGATSIQVKLDGVIPGSVTGDLEAKADKVVGAVVDDLAKLTASGNLADAGLKSTNLVQMAATGGVDELLYTSAADRAAAKSGLTKTATPQMAAEGGAGELVQTAAADRAQSKSGVVAANVVTEAAAASGADQIVTSAGASKIVKDSAVAIANVPTMAADGVAGNLIQTAAASKALSDGGVPITNIVTEAAAASGADQFVTSAGASKIVKDSGVAIANVPTMPANGVAGNLIQTVAANKAQSDAGIPVADVVTEAAAASGADQIVTSAGASKVVKDSAVALANVPTMPANGVAGNLIQTAGANKALSDAVIPVADVVTQAANAAAAGTLPVYAGATKVLADSLIPVQAAQLGLAITKCGDVFCLEIDIEGAAATIGVFNANAPFKFQILDFHALCTAANVAGTAKLNNAFAGGGNDITDAVVMAVQDVLTRATTIVGAVKTIALNGSLSVVKNAASDDGKGYIYAMKVA